MPWGAGACFASAMRFDLLCIIVPLFSYVNRHFIAEASEKTAFSSVLLAFPKALWHNSSNHSDKEGVFLMKRIKKPLRIVLCVLLALLILAGG